MGSSERAIAETAANSAPSNPKRLRWNRDIQEEMAGTISDEADIAVIQRCHRRQNSNADIPHDFEEHSYHRPTKCDVCQGLLVGLWSQGLQCKICLMNVHRGEGSGEHDDCRAEALLMSCPGHGNIMREKSIPNLGEAIHEIRQLATESPDFVEQVKDQIDKDIKALAKGVIVEVEVENQRSKHLRRLKDRVVPFIKSLDKVQARGELYIFLLLAALQALALLIMLPISVATCIVALSPKHGFLSDTSLRLSVVHNATVATALHVLFFLLSLIIRYYACLFKRKSSIVDRFLHDVFQINAKNDVGVTVAGAAGRARYWSNRFCISTIVSCTITSLVWHSVQPSSWESTTVSPLLGRLVAIVALSSIVIVTGTLSYFSSPNTISHEKDKEARQNDAVSEKTLDKKMITISHSGSSESRVRKSEVKQATCIEIDDSVTCQESSSLSSQTW